MTTTLHYEILPKSQQGLWAELGPVSQFGFVLYGGTAIALQLEHRTSLDFDFFTSCDFEKTKLLEMLPARARGAIVQDERNTLSLKTEEGVYLSFFGGIGIGRLGRPVVDRKYGIQLACLEDLLALKLAVVTQRAQWKDYFDMAALLRAGLSLADGLAGARALYGSAFAPRAALQALTFFEDGDLGRLAVKDREELVRAVQQVRALPEKEKGCLSEEFEINLPDILRICGSGIYVTGFNGGNCNPVTGDFSYGIEGFAFCNGKITHPIREMVVTGNMVSLWNSIIAAGSDARECTRWQIPTLAFDKADFSA